MDAFPDISTSEADLQFLRGQLRDLLGRRGADVREQLFQALVEYYSGPGRFYHNLHHVAEVLRLLGSMGVRAPGHEAGNLSPDELLFLDADLSILGAPAEIYSQYRAAIRREYDWVSEDVYRRERKRILENFVARDRLYFTDELRRRLEPQARRNLPDEIRALESA